MDVEKVELFKKKFTTMTYLSEDLFNDSDMDIMVDQVARQYVIRINDYFWAERLKHLVYSYPMDWWQAFRERWFPKWWLSKYPVQYIKKTVDVDALYPKLRMASQEPVKIIHQCSNILPWKDPDEEVGY